MLVSDVETIAGKGSKGRSVTIRRQLVLSLVEKITGAQSGAAFCVDPRTLIWEEEKG